MLGRSSCPVPAAPQRWLAEESSEIAADALLDRLAGRRREALAGDRFVERDVFARKFRERVVGDGGDQVLVGIAAAVGGEDLVGEGDLALRVEAELELGVDQDEAVARGDLPAAGQERHREAR